MKRREYIKVFSLGLVLPVFDFKGLTNGFEIKANTYVHKSDWHKWPDMEWVGPSYWANRLQDWVLRDGRAQCTFLGKNRSLHLLTLSASDTTSNLRAKVNIKVSPDAIDAKGCIGMRFGTRGPMDDFRSAAVFGKGLDVGLDMNGNLVVDGKVYETKLNKIPEDFDLQVKVRAEGEVEISIDSDNQSIVRNVDIPAVRFTGGFALLSDFSNDKKTGPFEEIVSFGSWEIDADNLMVGEDNLFGPICFAQYTLHHGVLKLTTQLSPIEKIPGHEVSLELLLDDRWVVQSSANLQHEGRSVHFRIDDYSMAHANVEYRIRLQLPLKDEVHHYHYNGVIAAEPVDQDELKVAVFSCNFHYGFPDSDVVENVSKLDPDVILFLGDQFYEGTGGFGAMYRGDYDKMCLDYLRKWMMFGWSYRELFRNKPCAIIPDDHDVYHGNVWGEGGKLSDTSKGFGASAQDSGGYKMPVDWVNMVQFTQTSHLPDPYDSNKVGEGISVYYTNWDYGGVSFAILEDRKFKSSPKNILPEEAQVNNGWILNDDFDIKKYEYLPAELLGSTQERFLENWISEWNSGVKMKAVLSQTNFAAVATLPEGAKTGAVIPSLEVPEKGEYVLGDKATVDMDSNGWPVRKRNRAVESIRKAFAFHIAGDQHLGSFVRYGVDEFGDSGYAFAGPALNNIWPRRFWPPVNPENHSYENPAYVGNHFDGLGNRVSVLAVANPHQQHKEPKIIHDRATGYGLVVFNKTTRKIDTMCWPRFIDPTQKNTCYPGWPISINQKDNYGRKPAAWLPEITISSEVLPVMRVFNEKDELVYALRLSEKVIRPWVYEMGIYSIDILVPENGKQKKIEKLKARKNQKKKISIEL